VLLRTSRAQANAMAASLMSEGGDNDNARASYRAPATKQVRMA
jgi:hypothetical protein